MRKPFVNSFTIAAGLGLGAALGLTAHAGSLHIFGSPSSVTAHTLASTTAEPSESPKPSESPEASPSPEPSESPEAAPSPAPVESPKATQSPEGDEHETEDGGTTQPSSAGSDDGSGDHQSGGDNEPETAPHEEGRATARPSLFPDYPRPGRFQSMRKPMIRALGITAGTVFITIGVAAQFGGADVFSTPSYGRPVSLQPSPHSSVAATPSPQPPASPPSVTAAGTVYPPYAGYGGGHDAKKKKGKG